MRTSSCWLCPSCSTPDQGRSFPLMWPPLRGLRIPPRRDFACSAGRGRGPRHRSWARRHCRTSSCGFSGDCVSHVSSTADSPRMPGAASVKRAPCAGVDPTDSGGGRSSSSGGRGGRWGPSLRQAMARNPPTEAPDKWPSQLTPSSMGKTPHTMLPYRKTTTIATRMSLGWRRRMPLRNRKATSA